MAFPWARVVVGAFGPAAAFATVIAACAAYSSSDPAPGDPDAADAGAADAPDGARGEDSSAAACSDGSPSCARLGRCCPSDKPFCELGIDYTGGDGGTLVACAERLGPLKVGDACSPRTPACGDGLACTVTTTGSRCMPLCTSPAACPTDSFCSVAIAGITETTGQKACGACDPVAPTHVECTYPSDACKIDTSATDPVCATDEGQSVGFPCSGRTTCASQTTCVCALEGGVGLGNDCVASDGGVCRALCYPSRAGQPCGGGTCTLASATFAYCKP